MENYKYLVTASYKHFCDADMSISLEPLIVVNSEDEATNLVEDLKENLEKIKPYLDKFRKLYFLWTAENKKPSYASTNFNYSLLIEKEIEYDAKVINFIKSTLQEFNIIDKTSIIFEIFCSIILKNYLENYIEPLSNFSYQKILYQQG